MSKTKRMWTTFTVKWGSNLSSYSVNSRFVITILHLSQLNQNNNQYTH